ncbi:phosphatase PAP2 family protein [Calidifontibacter terrae]
MNRPLTYSRPRTALIAETLLTFVAAVLLGYVTARSFLHTDRGMRLDDRMERILGGPHTAYLRMESVLTLVSVPTVVGITALAAVVAFVRRRPWLGLGVVVMSVAATFTTQQLKWHTLARLDGQRSFPSGHTTAALVWALCLVLVAPAKWRPALVGFATFLAGLIGTGTVAGRWHRPSDVVAAAFVCTGWAALTVLVVALLERGGQRAPYPPSRFVVPVILGALAAIATFFVIGFQLTGTDAGQIGAVIVLFATTAATAAGVGWVAILADRWLV